MKYLKLTATALLATGAASASYQVFGERADRRRFTAPGQFVDVNGHRLHVWAEGEGEPTIVIITALSTSSLQWAHILRKLAPDHRVLVYDRGGLGWSERPKGERTALRLAEELADLLAVSGEAGPYLVVGHSLGGTIAQMYAYRNPAQVAGMILVDSAHEDVDDAVIKEFGRFNLRVGQLARQRYTLQFRLRQCGIQRLRMKLGWRGYHEAAAHKTPPEWLDALVAWEYLSSRHRKTEISEFLRNNGQHRRQLRADRQRYGDFGDLPLTVISRSRELEGFGDGDSIAFNRRWVPLWLPYQQRLAALSSRGRLVYADRSGHNVHWDDPDTIVREINRMCDDVRASHRL